MLPWHAQEFSRQQVQLVHSDIQMYILTLLNICLPSCAGVCTHNPLLHLLPVYIPLDASLAGHSGCYLHSSCCPETDREHVQESQGAAVSLRSRWIVC